MSLACGRGQRGVALISVLLVFALAALMAMQLQRASTQDIKQMAAVAAGSQARWYASGGEALGRQILLRDWQSDKRIEDHSDAASDSWSELRNFPVEGGDISIKINDLSGFLNLNALRWEDQELMFSLSSIFAQLGLPLPALDRLRAFYRPDVTADKKPQLLHLEQLREVAGLSLEQVQRLSPLLSALPIPEGSQDTAVLNVNTVPLELMSLLGMPRNDISEITRRQKYKKYRTKDGPPASFPKTISSNIGVYSEYFEILVAARHDGRHAYLRSLVYRDSAGKIQVLQRTLAKHAVNALLQQRGSQ